MLFVILEAPRIFRLPGMTPRGPTPGTIRRLIDPEYFSLPMSVSQQPERFIETGGIL